MSLPTTVVLKQQWRGREPGDILELGHGVCDVLVRRGKAEWIGDDEQRKPVRRKRNRRK